ncbi:MAG: PAS domain S-box protein [Flavobacteriales bacterium]|nr:PAS domain S-box protein [Flavobacteriales bacterium]MBS4042140.1 PAS domain S-box protein [Flavobacteriales bacterium]
MKYTFPIIGIGASAGGLEPLELFFEFAKPNSGFSYVLIQHLAPNHKSLMDELLSRHTTLPIEIIQHEMMLEPGKIYLNPPKKIVDLQDGHFILTEKEDRQLSFPISSFFNSLAEQAHEKACAIIMSGTGSDGSEGVKYIKEKGGLVIAQDPTTAKFDGMPKSAILTGAVDKICAVEQMHREIEAFFFTTNEIHKEILNSQDTKGLISAILTSVYQQIGVDFTDYKYSTVSRRIARRMSLLGFPEMLEYLKYIQTNNQEPHLLAKELLIGVTRFFRDEENFEFLRQQVIPRLIEENIESKSIRIWVPACSTGEEAYTIAILVKDYLRRQKLQFDVSIFATDLDKEAIKNAANRIFPENISTEIPPEFLNLYFIPQRKGFTIAKEIREMIIFSAHNLVQDPPFNRIDLISCRNFLIYLNSNLQQRVFSMFQFSLRTHGFLFLGASESLGDASEHFIEFDKKSKVYLNKENKKAIQKIRSSRKSNPIQSEFFGQVRVNSPIPNSGRSKLLNEIQNVLIQEFVPDSIVTDEDFNLLHTTGNAHRWLTLPSGEITTNVLKMLPESLSIPFEVVANKVMHSGVFTQINKVEVDGMLRQFYKGVKFLTIKLRRVQLNENGNQLIATFEPEISSESEKDFEKIEINAASKEKINILERELRINRENLQSTIEELESSNEELQAANEELQSSNEELESVNEELYTVNAEYQQKIHELSDINNDLNNLIHSTQIAMLFLDVNLNIRRFTPAIREILDLMPHDVGRNISHFRGKVQLEDLMGHIEKVFDTQTSFEAQIRDTKGEEFLLNISPFRTHTGEIHGVVLVFFNVSRYNRMERALEVSNDALEILNSKHASQTELFELIARNSRDMISILDLNGKLKYCSPSGTEITGYPLERLAELDLLNRIPDPAHKKKWKNAIEAIKDGKTPGLIQFKFKTWAGVTRWMESNLKPIQLDNGKIENILISTRDINQRMLQDVEMKKLALIAEQTSNAVIITDSHGKITFVNDAFENMTGYTEQEVLGKKPGQLLQGKESTEEAKRLMAKGIKKKVASEVEMINYTKSGNKYLVRIQTEPMFDKNQELIGFFSIQNDVTLQKEQEQQIHRLNLQIREQNLRLQEVNKSLEEFAYVASHDLKTPVRNISGLMDIIHKRGDDLDPEKRKQYLDVIRTSSKELGRLIENLLEYSRTGTLGEELETVETEELVNSVIQFFERELEVNEALIKTEITVKKIKVYPILFKRLITNLITNSLKYRSDRVPEISISCFQKNDWIVFKFSDNGMGIPENQQGEIFKIFKTLNYKKDSNGIGLSVCKKIAELHGGKIWVESDGVNGSIFWIQFNTGT